MPFYSFEGIKPVVAPNSYVHPTAVILGDVWIAENCYIGPLASIRGDFGRIRICKGSNVQDCCILHGYPEHELVLHENSHIGHGAIVHNAIIEKDVLIGMHAVILDYAVVGEKSIIAANTTVLTHYQVPPKVLFAGSPGKVKRKLTDDNIKAKWLGTQAYHQLTQRSLAGIKEVDPLTQAQPERSKAFWNLEFDANLNTHQTQK